MLALPTAAQAPAPLGAPALRQSISPAGPAAPLGVDDGSVEVGVEYVVDYPPGWNDLPATAPDALGLRNQLVAGGWTSRYAWGNGSAWEQDWKGLTKPGG